MNKKTLREEITDALVEGFSGKVIVEVCEEETLVYVDGYGAPIRVVPDDVIVPDELEECASGIALDVQAIMAMWE